MQFSRLAALALLLASGACTFTIGDGSDSASEAGNTPATATEAPATSTTSEAGTSPTSTEPTSTSTASDESTSTQSADSSSTSTEPTEGSETGPASGACGWVAEQKIYACGGVGEDPDGLIPIECPEPPVAGAPCDGGQGPIADPGCCSEGVEAYCYLGQLVVTVCE